MSLGRFRNCNQPGMNNFRRHGVEDEASRYREMGYRAGLGILRLEKLYSKPRLEAASQRAVQLHAFSYQSLKSILKRSLDRQLLLDPEAVSPSPRHENLRRPCRLRV